MHDKQRPTPYSMQISDRLVAQIFNSCFETSHRTILIGGGKEPIYRPGLDSSELNKIIYRQDFYASALHEAAHWCIAGKERRKKPDFGYIYQETRCLKDQIDFCNLEAKPQALESIFHDAIGSDSFTPSLDGIEFQNDSRLVEEFSKIIQLEKIRYLKRMPPRAKIFAASLIHTKKTSKKKPCS